MSASGRNSETVKKILMDIYDQPGLIPDIIMNLNAPKDDNDEINQILLSGIAIIGNMA